VFQQVLEALVKLGRFHRLVEPDSKLGKWLFEWFWHVSSTIPFECLMPYGHPCNVD
jgi:hypothetical protein